MLATLTCVAAESFGRPNSNVCVCVPGTVRIMSPTPILLSSVCFASYMWFPLPLAQLRVALVPRPGIEPGRIGRRDLFTGGAAC
jgi:hypothetical protein